MAGGTRHRVIVPHSYNVGDLATVYVAPDAYESHPARVQTDVADRVVHRALRVTLDARCAKRSEPRAVADQRRRASVGEPVEADPLMEVQRDSSLPNLEARD